MMEAEFIAALRRLPLHEGAQGLSDDVARLGDLVITTDTMIAGVHFLPDDPPESIAWKLVAVNASDLAAKGAEPLGCLKSHALGEDEWDRAFLGGMDQACRHFHLPLLGGDTVRMPRGSPK